MNAKTLVIVGLAAAALLGAAFVVASQKETAYTPTREAGRKLFPTLAKDVNAVVELDIRSKDGQTVLKKEDGHWGVADKGGYPVDFDKVKQVVVGVAEFEIIDELSKNPANYKMMGVQAPTDEGAESKQLTLKDKSGAVLADVIIGNAKASQGFGGKSSLYVRPASGEQPYHVSGQINVLSEASNWMQREICKIESNRVSQVVTIHPDGERLAIRKDSPEGSSFNVQDLPEGRELMWAGAANGIGGALQYLSLEDVKPIGEVTLDAPTVAEFTTFDGVRLTVKSAESDGKTWVTLDAAFDESLRQEPVGPPPPTEGEEASAPPPTPTLKPVEDVKKEVADLNAQFHRWAYAVPGYTAANFRKRMSDLLKKPADEAPADGAFTDETSGNAIDLLKGGELPLDDSTTGAQDDDAPAEPPTDGGESNEDGR